MIKTHKEVMNGLIPAFISSRDVLNGKSVEGMVLANAKPLGSFFERYKFDKCYCFFFSTVITDKDISQFHPNAKFTESSVVRNKFESSQVINTENLCSVDIIQINPTNEPYSSELILKGENSELKTNVFMNAKGSTVARFELSATNENFRLCVKNLPNRNAKPIIKRTFKSGLVTMNHS